MPNDQAQRPPPPMTRHPKQTPQGRFDAAHGSTTIGDMVSISTINTYGEEVAMIGIKSKYLQNLRLNALETALNYLVDKISESGTPLRDIAFRVGAYQLNDTLQSK